MLTSGIKPRIHEPVERDGTLMKKITSNASFAQLAWKVSMCDNGSFNTRDISLLKWYYDENRIFPIKAILKHIKVVCIRKITLFAIFKYLFSFQRYSSFSCKLADCWRHTLNQILIKYDEERYLSQFVSEMFDSLQ